MKSFWQAGDSVSLPLFSHLVFRSLISFFFFFLLPTHALYCESVSGCNHMLGRWEGPRPVSEACHTGFLMFVDRERRWRGITCVVGAVLSPYSRGRQRGASRFDLRP